MKWYFLKMYTTHGSCRHSTIEEKIWDYSAQLSWDCIHQWFSLSLSCSAPTLLLKGRWTSSADQYYYVVVLPYHSPAIADKERSKLWKLSTWSVQVLNDFSSWKIEKTISTNYQLTRPPLIPHKGENFSLQEVLDHWEAK